MLATFLVYPGYPPLGVPADLSGGEEMLKRTFHKWKWNIFDTFGLSIECEKTAPYSIKIINKYTL